MKKIAIYLVFCFISLGVGKITLAYTNECIITDVNDKKYQIKGGPREIYLEQTDNSPKKWLSIRAQNIDEVIFTPKEENRIHVSVLLKSGKLLEGDRPVKNYKIRGENELGAVFKIGYDKIKKIKYIVTTSEDQSGYMQYYNWKVVDGGQKYSADALILVDSHLTNYERISHNEAKIYDKYVINDALYFGEGIQKDLTTFPFLQGLSEIDIPIVKINYLEITGNQIDGKPEVIVETSEGKKATVVMRMATKINRKNGFNPTYGAFDKKDYYVLDNIKFGRTGVSFFPLRKIVIKRR